MANGKGGFSQFAMDKLPSRKPPCNICKDEMKNYYFVGNYDPFDLPDENQTLIPAKDLDLYKEVEYLKAETLIREDTDVEKIQSMSYDYARA